MCSCVDVFQLYFAFTYGCIVILSTRGIRRDENTQQPTYRHMPLPLESLRACQLRFIESRPLRPFRFRLAAPLPFAFPASRLHTAAIFSRPLLLL